MNLCMWRILYTNGWTTDRAMFARRARIKIEPPNITGTVEKGRGAFGNLEHRNGGQSTVAISSGIYWRAPRYYFSRRKFQSVTSLPWRAYRNDRLGFCTNGESKPVSMVYDTAHGVFSAPSRSNSLPTVKSFTTFVPCKRRLPVRGLTDSAARLFSLLMTSGQERGREGETIFRVICIYQRIRGIAEITVAAIRAF